MTTRLRLIAMVVLAAAAPVGVLPAQTETGKIVGRVLDADQGAPVGGAVIELVGVPTPRRTTSAIDGRYTFTDVPAGEVGIRVRMIGYGPKLVTGVRVPAGGVVTQDVSLNGETIQLEELNVTAEAERGSVSKALDEQRNATNIVNAITAEQIAKSPDGDAGQAVQRISGVTVQDGKYVFVRGLGERYTTTALNGARIPSPEPERKVVPLDLFPSGLLEGITTSKTFTPDQPGDFSGAAVNLKTREFPAKRVVTFSASTGLNTAATGRTILKAPTVGQEWLGFAGSARRLPVSIANAGDLSGVGDAQLNSFIASFRNAWSAERGSGAPNGSFGLSVGGEDPVFGQRIGYLASATYSSGQEIRDDETRSSAKNGPTSGTALPFNAYAGSTSRGSVLWGGLLNLSTTIGSTTRLSLNNTYTRSADNEASVLTGANEEFGQDFQFTRLTFVERAVRSNQLAGEHLFGGRHLINWSATISGVTRNEPDRSDLGYSVDANGNPTQWFGQSRFATRTFSNLDETGSDLGASYQLALGPKAKPIVVKVGGARRSVERDADTRAYDIINRTMTATDLQRDPEAIFDGQAALSGQLLLRANSNGGRYTASDEITAGFAMVEIPIGGRFKLIGGGRVERWNLDVITRTVQGAEVAARPRNTDVLPSLALNIALTDRQNLRLSASQTLSRPEYRELSPVPYFEQVGLLTTFGNSDLRRALIQNYDARWEWFPNPGEVVSIGVFAKRFENPIEKIIVLQAGTAALSYVNATSADNLGAEVEFRKNLGGIATSLLPFSVFANTTVMRSRIEPGSQVLTNADRPMVGQSGYIINGGVNYLHPSGRFNLTALYNVAGRRIAEAGATGLPDTYEEARSLIDVTGQATLWGDLSMKIDAKNLLDAPYHFVQGDVTRARYRSGRVLSVGFSWRP
ncbi:MAG: outer membrane beta-barrel protein [Gemmatimonadales bacterium]|nr:outer membrane beta-barrel protein [Gemmatimonadales bacterium]